MINFPNTIFTPRETENLPGIVYDPEDKKNMYAEDFQNLGNSINLVQKYLKTFLLDFNFANNDGWGQSITGTSAVQFNMGNLWLYSGESASSSVVLTPNASMENFGIDFNKNPYFSTIFKADTYGDIIVYIMAGGWNTHGFGFKIASGNLYGVVINGGSESTVLLESSFDASDYVHLDAQYISGVGVNFYVENELVDDIAITDLDDEDISRYMQIRYSTLAGNDGSMNIRKLIFSQEL